MQGIRRIPRRVFEPTIWHNRDEVVSRDSIDGFLMITFAAVVGQLIPGRGGCFFARRFGDGVIRRVPLEGLAE